MVFSRSIPKRHFHVIGSAVKCSKVLAKRKVFGSGDFVPMVFSSDYLGCSG
jgi:hypothetical protein